MVDSTEIFMEPRARQFLDLWPEVPEHLRPAHSRFLDVGLLWVDPNVDADPQVWPGSLRLTSWGEVLKDLVDSRSYNYFTYREIEPCFPGAIPERAWASDQGIGIFRQKPSELPAAPRHGLQAAIGRNKAARERLRRLLGVLGRAQQVAIADPVTADEWDEEAAMLRLYSKLFVKTKEGKEDYEALAAAATSHAARLRK